VMVIIMIMMMVVMPLHIIAALIRGYWWLHSAHGRPIAQLACRS
jgi:hypothetical protein